MRKRNQGNGFSLHAISGTHVVILGIDITEKDQRKGLLGFAIHRHDKTENEQYWLPGYKTFQSVTPHPIPGSLVSTRDAPVQSLVWSDYTAKPGYHYTYTIVPITGKPKQLIEGKRLSVSIQTESESIGEHAVFFNRAVIGSEAYARKFGNKPPDQVPGNLAYRWLSRGLEEAILNFIAQARNKHFSLRASVYEFNWPPVLEAFSQAARRGVDVCIVYDDRKQEPGKSTKAAARKAGIGHLLKPRRANKSYLSHNKFIVLLKDNKPVEVWTGSTNFTESGLFGQANVGHLVRDANIASAYLEYWQQLDSDTPASRLRVYNETASRLPDKKDHQDTQVVFSPRKSLAALEWYAKRLATAKSSAAFTAAFGVNQLFADVLKKPKPYLRFVLLEKPDAKLNAILTDPNVRTAIGTSLTIQAAQDLEHWLVELKNPLGKFVLYVHTKFMLVDPLSEQPTVITGSANFSDASTKNNDENMLVIQGNTRIADIYFGEFMRLFDHFKFRDVINRLAAKADSHAYKSAFLTEDDSWLKPYFTKGSYKFLQRELFA